MKIHCSGLRSCVGRCYLSYCRLVWLVAVKTHVDTAGGGNRSSSVGWLGYGGKQAWIGDLGSELRRSKASWGGGARREGVYGIGHMAEEAEGHSVDKSRRIESRATQIQPMDTAEVQHPQTPYPYRNIPSLQVRGDVSGSNHTTPHHTTLFHSGPYHTTTPYNTQSHPPRSQTGIVVKCRVSALYANRLLQTYLQCSQAGLRLDLTQPSSKMMGGTQRRVPWVWDGM